MYTDEQQHIIDTIAADLPEGVDSQLYKTSAVAGSGKTHTLIGIANAVQIKRGLYIAFNKSVADEASMKFPSNIECKTIHGLAYKHVIKGSGQKIEELNIDSITTKHRPVAKRKIIRAINDFFNSSELSLSFIDELIEPKLASVAKAIITKMVDKEMPATFGFIMKYFYLQLHSGAIEVSYDMVMLDEAGDLSEVTLEIFKLLKSPRKVLVGDPHQNIYAFMNTVNGFEKLKDEGISLTLSQSFRVDEKIAEGIEKFCQKYMSPNMVFKGVHIDDRTVKSKVYLARTNAALISRMIELHEHKIKYSTLRDAKDIFALPLALISVKSGREVYRSEFKYLERDYAAFNADQALRQHYDHKFHRYLRDIHGDDVNLVSALRLLETHNYKTIFDTFNMAKNQPKTTQAVTLATAHTSKGGTYDSVYIENDLNTTIQKIINEGGPQSEEDLIELNLYYVACSRCRVELLNAHHI
jgi:F-box protein 18 (helicase)